MDKYFDSALLSAPTMKRGATTRQQRWSAEHFKVKKGYQAILLSVVRAIKQIKVVCYGKFWTSCCRSYPGANSDRRLAIYILFAHECHREDGLRLPDHAGSGLAHDPTLLDYRRRQPGISAGTAAYPGYPARPGALCRELPR